MSGKSGIYLDVPESLNSNSSTLSRTPSIRSLSPQSHYVPQRENPTRKVVDSLLDTFLEEKLKCSPNSVIMEILELEICEHNDNPYHIYQWLFDNQNTLKYKSLLGFFLLMGIGCNQDLNMAYKLFMKGARKNYLINKEMVSDCYLNGWGTQKNEEMAVHWYRSCADEGSVYGSLALGFCYANGKGVKKDEVLAIRYFRSCERFGNELAKKELRKLRFDDEGGVAKNKRSRVEMRQR
ncbi:6709_t:CDS:1 [Acaulospora morrowiae]|uniref:6709_t:CDS:1 n=1 Tax=Acaulospora morrowiae TaxID=94023 RepID=A0A9N9CV47_9GLOM|nr:6709_t:CDS:1 [Acaulospora morrowiae]